MLAIFCLSLLFTACRTRTDEDRSEPNLCDLLSAGPVVWRDWSAVQEPYNDSGEPMVNYVARQGRREVLRLELDVTADANDSEAGMAGWIQLRSNRPPFLFIRSDSGGAHCCGRAWVYEPADPMRLVFDSAWYGPDGRLRLRDLNHDGSLEIIQNITTFHYYDDMCYAISPGVDAIFAWDEGTRRFVPANNRFPALWQDTLDEARNGRLPGRIIPAREMAKDFDELDSIKASESGAIERAVNLVYAGYEREAFEWLARQFERENGRRICETLRDYLQSDNYYRCLNKLPMIDREEVMISRAAGFAADMLRLTGELDGPTNAPAPSSEQAAKPEKEPQPASR